MPNWLLPENIADVLPSEARKTEELRRGLLDQFRRYGYELVMPPMLEYVDSLMPFPDQDMDLRMFKLVDQLSGRTMGLRADMTIQVARIDAHLLNRKAVTRISHNTRTAADRCRDIWPCRAGGRHRDSVAGAGLSAAVRIVEGHARSVAQRHLARDPRRR
jgi:hypothetical protein